MPSSNSLEGAPQKLKPTAVAAAKEGAKEGAQEEANDGFVAQPSLSPPHRRRLRFHRVRPLPPPPDERLWVVAGWMPWCGLHGPRNL